MEKAKTLVLLDAHAIIHRAYHALPDFMSSKGEPTGALYGLSNMVIKIIDELKPDYIFACYDLPQKTFRHIAYEEYKAGRAKTDEALITQLKNSRQIFEAFNIPVFDSTGFEADDLLGTFVERFKEEIKKGKIKIIIASGDMDTMQLVYKDKVLVYTLKKGITDTILYDEEKVVERFGFKPEFLPDYKGLRGDPSDNIIGIKGIGEKTATTLIQKFGTVENIYKNLKKDKKIFKDLKITDRIISLLEEGEEEALFSKTLAQIRKDAPIKDFDLEKSFWENFDLEKIEQTFNLFDFRSLLSRLRNFAKRGGVSAKSELDTLFPDEIKKEENINEEDFQEVAVALWILDSDITNPKMEDVLNFARAKNFKEAKDVIFEKLKKEENLFKVYEEIEKPIIKIVKKMEEKGVLIDQKYFEKLSSEYKKELDSLTKKIYEISGTEFNINSPKQLSEVLFEKMRIKTNKKRNQSGNISTNISVLEELEEENPIIKEIIAYRELQKLLSTYIDVIPKMVEDDGRLHSKFLQNGTTTGRFSSQDPNLQNLPIKTELGKKIRNGFVAQKGYKLLALDYSQIELRVAALLSGDTKMIKIFKEGKDIHSGVASFVFEVPILNVDSEMRRKAKVINFGIIYGMGINALRKSLGGTKEEAEKFYLNYFHQFEGLKNYLENVKLFAQKYGYTETLFGRRRYFKNINSRIPFLKNMAERTAINAPIQGTATADIIKLAILFAEQDLVKVGLEKDARLILQIHDELVYEVKEEFLEKTTLIIKKSMEEVLKRSYLKIDTEIPLKVSFGVGNNLGELK